MQANILLLTQNYLWNCDALFHWLPLFQTCRMMSYFDLWEISKSILISIRFIYRQAARWLLIDQHSFIYFIQLMDLASEYFRLSSIESDVNFKKQAKFFPYQNQFWRQPGYIIMPISRQCLPHVLQVRIHSHIHALFHTSWLVNHTTH